LFYDEFGENRMWANAQRDGRPAEYRWRPVLNAAKFGSVTLLKCRAVFVSDIAIFVLKRDVKLQLTNCRAVTLPKYESARLGGCKVNSAPGKIP